MKQDSDRFVDEKVDVRGIMDEKGEGEEDGSAADEEEVEEVEEREEEAERSGEDGKEEAEQEENGQEMVDVD